jgi:hypothetical protein
MQKDHDRNDPVGPAQIGQIQTVVRQAMEREALGLGLFLEHEQQGGTPPIRPFQQQGDVELAKALAQAFFQLLFADRQDVCAAIDGPGLDRGKEGDRLAGRVSP